MPLRACSCATDSAAGTTAQPGWNRPRKCESSTSSPWAAIAPANAAETASVENPVPGTNACGGPPIDKAKESARRPDGRREPSIIAAKVSMR